MKQNLTSLFNKFAGREVQPPDTSGPDPVIEEMRKLARDNGLTLRACFPGYLITKDYRLDRVNALIEKGSGGKYRIGGFSVG